MYILLILLTILLLYSLFISYKFSKAKLKIDIEKEKYNKINELLSEKEEYLTTIIQSEPECVKLLSRDGTLLEINPAGAALVDADSPEKLLGKCIYDVVATEYLEPYKRLVENVFSGLSQTLEFKITSLKGNSLWMESHAVPMYGANSDIVALLAITRDITARKKAEAIAKSKQEELMRACRLLSVTEMASALAHELNQPLCALMSYAESLEASFQEPESKKVKQQELIDKIIYETDRSGKIIQRIRDFVCKRDINLEKIDLNVQVSEVLDHIGLNPLDNTLNVIFNQHVDPIFISADPILIQQVLINIITNAIDAINCLDKCDQEKSITIQSIITNSNSATISVKDNGIGFNNIDIDRVFEPFYTTKSGGVGIGMSISRSIVESHGGRIEFIPNDSSGVTVKLQFPMHIEPINEIAA